MDAQLNILDDTGGFAGLTDAPRQAIKGLQGKLISIDPRHVRLSPLNPRSPERLEQLSQGALARTLVEDGQTTPVIVRRITGDPLHKYEVIAGARRHHAQQARREAGEKVDLVALVVDVSDAEAAKIAIADNVGRAPTTELELARFTAHCLEHAFDGDKRRLRAALNLTDTRLSRLLALAAWPPELIAAFGPSPITQTDACALNARLSDSEQRERLLAEARAIAQEQRSRIEAGQNPLAGVEVRRRLLVKVTGAPMTREITDEQGETVLSVRTATERGVLLYIPAPKRQQATLIEAIAGAVKAVGSARV